MSKIVYTNQNSIICNIQNGYKTDMIKIVQCE
jgi:hypothetical protein